MQKQKGLQTFPSWLSRQKACITADWLHLSLLTTPRVAGPSNVSLRMYLGDLFDRLAIILNNPYAPISPCIGENFHIRYRDIPDLEAEDLLKIFHCGKNCIATQVQQDFLKGMLGNNVSAVNEELEWAFKHLRHTEMEAFREHQSLFTHFAGFESDLMIEKEFGQRASSSPQGSAYPWASRT